MSRSILIIDDDDAIREVVRTTLEMIGGHRVLAAADGGSGLELAASALPDAILLDVMMPGMDGPTTFRRLRELPATREIPVIMLTAKVQATDRRALEGLGTAGTLAKPFDPLALPEQIAAILGWDRG